MLHSLQEKKKNFPFHIMVRESENNVEHLRFRGAQSGIVLGRHSSFGSSRVGTVCYQQTYPSFLLTPSRESPGCA